MKSKSFKFILPAVGIGLVYALAMNSCSSSSSTSALTGNSALSPSGLAEAAVSSPFEASSSSSSYTLKGSQRKFSASFADRKAVIDALLAATDKESCSFTVPTGGSATNADCYGNLIVFEAGGTHPDGTYSSPGGGRSYTLPTGDVGIWSAETAGGEACVAAQVTKMVDNYTDFAYTSQLTGAALYCFLNASGVALPNATGESVTLTADQLTDFGFTDGAGNVFAATSAVVEFTEDSAGNDGLKYTVEGSFTTGATSRPFKTIVRYAPQSDGGYAGTVSYYVRDSATNDFHCSPDTGMTSAGSMTFSRDTSSSDVSMLLNTADFCGTSYDPLIGTNDSIVACDRFGSSNDVNSSSADGWGSNWNRVAFSYDPSTMIGKYSYLWMAGNQDGWSRTFNAEITDATTGVGYFGFGPDVATISGGTCTTSASLGSITKMICNWAGPSSITANRQTVDLVQKQTMTKNATSGLWESGTNEIRFAPTNTCNIGSSSVNYCAAASDTVTDCTANSKTNDNFDGSAVTNNLESLADYTTDFGSQPSAPTF